MKEIDKLYRSQIRQKYWQSPDSKPTNVLDKQLNSKFLAPTSAMTPISPGALKSEDNSRSSTFMGLETGLPRQNSEHVRS